MASGLHVIINHTQKNPVAEELLPNPGRPGFFVRLLKCAGLSLFCIVRVLKGIQPFLWMGFVKGESVE